SAKNLALTTLHRRRACISEFGKWGRRKRLWAEDPTEELPPIKKPKRVPRPFDGAELDRLMALKLPPIEVVLRAMLYYTGLRATPICRIKLGDLSFAPATFKNGVTAPGSIRATSKGKKESVKPMHPALFALLKDVAPLISTDPKAPLFAQPNGRPWT